ncbi:hypothetical protein Back2_14700 [Nocardioides baekrokdamisoli]|uniref:Uncharacterized protein n=1 Tax=Nocardioides baekrokdamisoli TaxID=1804624 RepID=A0A3G9IXQ1_9ACTN|nr:DUF6575 domain-containing protein [Nocardioides baekrokdamisoli]BBH17183.1 hypothetical protein Back2_14700 [Nocardioides baekrokdamisoli]
MNLDASAALPYGRLALEEVFFEHDGPKLFGLRSAVLGLRIIAICIDEDERESSLAFIYVVMGARRYFEVRAGHMSLREAIFAADRGCLWRIEHYSGGRSDSVTARLITAEEIPESDLPARGARLAIPTPTAAALDLGELREIAVQGLRTVAAIELEAYSENATEFPLRSLGVVGAALQDSVDSLAQEHQGRPTERGAISPAITEHVQMSVIGLRAASFAVVIGADKRGGMVDSGPFVEATLSRLTTLVGLGANAEELTAALRQYGARARNKFASLLRAVNGAGSGIGIVTVPQSGPASAATMTPRQVVAALTAIDAVEPSVEEIPVRRGALIGLNTRLHTFELTDLATAQRYAGKVAPAAYSQVDGLHVGQTAFVSATVRVEIDFAADDAETGRRYTLLAIAALAE